MRRPDNGHRTAYLVDVLGASRPLLVQGTPEQRAAAIAGAQRGMVNREQLLAAGISSSAIGRMLGSGYLHPVHRGVYSVGHAASVWLGRETAALLACGLDAVLSHLTAARLRGFLRKGLDAGLIHVTVAGRHGPSLAGAVVHRTNTLADHDVRVMDGLPVTAPLRALVEIADLLDQEDLDWSLDEAIQLRQVSARVAAQAAAEARGRRGAGRLAAAVARHVDTGITESEAEKWFRALIDKSGLPQPRFNFRLHGYKVDAYWPEHGLVVEVDSVRFHSSRPKMEHDAAKGATLVAAGLTLMRFMATQVRDQPLTVVARVAKALAHLEERRESAA